MCVHITKTKKAHFEQIAKESPEAYNNLPIPDFSLLYKHKEYVRVALVAYLNLAKKVNSGSIDNVKSVMDALEKSNIDIKLREKLISETKKMFDLMPEPKRSPAVLLGQSRTPHK